MAWILGARGMSFYHLRSHPPASSRDRSGVTRSSVGSPSGDPSPGKINGSGRQRRRPTAAEVRIAIGVDEDPRMGGGNPSSLPPASSPSSSSSLSSSPFMDFLATTPIGQPESPAERSLRQLGEWVAERTEGKAGDVLMNVMIFCLCALPLWLFLLLVAAGIIKLPPSLSGVEDFFL